MLARFFLNIFKIFVIAGHLALYAAWMGAGLLLAVAPAFYAAFHLADRKSAAGLFIVLLVVTGLLSIKVKALNRVVDVFHFGGRVILAAMEKMIAEVDRVAREQGDTSLK